MRLPPRFVALSVLVVLVVGSVGFAGASAVASQPVADNQVNTSDSPNYLSPPPEDVTREEFDSVGVDVTGAVATDTQRLHGEFATRTFDHQYDAIEDPETREELIDQTVDAVETRVATLDDEQARVFAGYGDGTESVQTIFRNAVIVDEAGQQQLELLQHIRDRSRADSEVSTDVEFEVRLANLNAETTLLPRPLTDEIRPAVLGSGDRPTIYAQATEESLVLASFADGEFVRQATLRGERDREAVDQFTLGDDPRIVAAFERGEVLYPWIFENAIGAPSVSGFGETSVYAITADHPQGSFDAYLDGATTNAFHEYQTLRPEGLPVTDTRTGGTEQLDLTVEMTAPTGPMQVTLVDEETGEPVDAVVSINDQRAGSTGTDGQLWTVQPSGEFRITATTATGETAVVIVS